MSRHHSNSNIVRQVEKCFNASGILLLKLQRIPIVSIFTHLFTYICCKEFQFGNEFNSYETKWQLHCCLMRWHFLNREFIKSELGRSSNRQSKLGKKTINENAVVSLIFVEQQFLWLILLKSNIHLSRICDNSYRTIVHIVTYHRNREERVVDFHHIHVYIYYLHSLSLVLQHWILHVHALIYPSCQPETSI